LALLISLVKDHPGGRRGRTGAPGF